MARLAFEAVPRALDANANPVSYGQLRIFQAGTTTAVTTYKDRALTTAHTFPVIADAAGVFPEVYVAEGTYKARIADANGVTLQEADYVANGQIAQVYDSVAAMKAATTLQAGDWVETRGYYSVGDRGRASYKIVTQTAFGSAPDGYGDHTITSTTNGNLVAQLVHPIRETPFVYGGKGDGVADDTAPVQKCFDYAMQIRSTSAGSKVTVGGWDGVFAVSSPIVLSGASIAVMPIRFKAIGTAWNVDNGVFENDADNSEFYSITVDCNRLSNGVKDNGRSNVWYSLRVFHMSAAFLSYGYYKPNGPTNETNLIEPVIYQWSPSDAEFSTPANFTADCARVFKSDCYIKGGTLSWARTNYCGQNGIHHLCEVHLNNGREGIGGTDQIAIEFGKNNQTGELNLDGVYVDDAKCEFYSPNINFNGVKVLVNTAKMTFTNGVMQFYAKDGGVGFAATGFMYYFTIMGSPETIKLIDYGTGVWTTAEKDLATLLNTKVNSAPKKAIISFANQNFVAAFNADNDFLTYMSNGSYVNFANTYGGVKLPVNSTEPIYVSSQMKGFIAYSDGTASTNNFGVAGEGLYVRTSPTNWTKL